jgi:hypothetical protein
VTEIKGFTLSDKLETNTLYHDSPKSFIGVLPNLNDYGYCIVRYDRQTLNLLNQNLYRINDPLTRAQALRNMWH